MCCLGCLAIALGAETPTIENYRSPTSMLEPHQKPPKWALTKHWNWLWRKTADVYKETRMFLNTSEAGEIMTINDWRIEKDEVKSYEKIHVPSSEAHREEMIASRMKPHGIELEFIN